MADDAPKESFIGGLARISSRWQSIVNFWAFFFGLVIIACFGVYLLGLVLRPLVPGARITTTEGGAYIIELGGKRSVQWLFSASSKPASRSRDDSPGNRFWSNSGIDVTKGDRLKLRVSGAVNLAIHHLVRSAETDNPPYFHWTGSDGYEPEQAAFFRPADDHRQRWRLAIGAPQGMLLMQVVPPGANPEVRPDGEHLYLVGSGRDGPFRMRQSGTLYFALNEVPLDETMHDYYVITQQTDPKYVKEHPVKDQEKAWTEIVRLKYWDLWFDDNAGSFLVTAEIE